MAASRQTALTHASSAAAPGRSIDGKPVCYNCGSKGHTGDRCKQPYCDRCQQFRHASGECSRACRKCGALDHRIDGGLPCKNYQCKECGLFGHIYAECPNIICNVCSEYGHLARDCPNKGKAPSSGSSPGIGTASTAAATPQPTNTAQLQQQVPVATPAVQQQRQLQQTSVVTSAEEGQKRARVMDTLMSRLEEYALSLLLNERKLALICRLSEDELRAILGRANAAHNLDAAAERIQQQLDKQQQQQQQQQQQAAAAGSNVSSSSTAGAVTAAAAPTPVFGSNSTTRVASINGPTSAAGAATVAPSSSSSVALPTIAANGPYKSDAASRAHVCGRCGERGHNKDSCTTPKCSSCGRFRHTAGHCSKACRDCGGLDHRSGPGHPMCINYKCRECGLYGHVYAECPNIRCNMCSEIGHKALECPTIVCNICGGQGHKARDCTACSRCGQQGHRPKDCPGIQADVCCVHCGQWGHAASTCSRAVNAASSTAAEAAAAVPTPASDSQSAAVAPLTAVSRPPPPPPPPTAAVPAVRPAVVAAGGAGAWAAAAAGRRVVTPATVKLLPPAAADDSAAALERQQHLLDLLMSRIEGYAATLVGAEPELAALCRVADGDLWALLETANPEQQLDAVIKHVHAVQLQEAAAITADTAAEASPPPPPPPIAVADAKPKQQQQQLPAQQQHRPGQGSWARPLQIQQSPRLQSPPKQQRQQQVLSDAELSPGRSAAGGDTIKPAELLPQHAAALATEFPGYFPGDWQQYASWRSLEEHMAFPDPQNKSRAQYRQRRQYFQALTSNAMLPAAAIRGAAVQAATAQPAADVPPTLQQQREELEQQQQCTEQADMADHGAYTAPAGDILPPLPADVAAWQSADDTATASGEPFTADLPADSLVVQDNVRPLSWVRLLPLDSVDEEALGMRFNNALDIMLPQFESYVQSLNEDKWRLLARIDESDLAELLVQPGAEQQLDLLLSSVLQNEGQQREQQPKQHISLDHQQDVRLQEYQQQHTAKPPAVFAAAQPHEQQQHADGPTVQPPHEQRQHYQQLGAASHDLSGQTALQPPPLRPYYQTAVATPGIGLQQQYGFAQHSHKYTPAISTTASAGMGYSGLGIGMAVGLGIAGYRPDPPTAAAAYPGNHDAAYQRGLQFSLQQQQPLSQGAAFLQQLQQQHIGNGVVGSLPQMHHLALQQQVPEVAGASMQLTQSRHQQPGVAGQYGAAGAYYRRSSTGTAGGDDAREQDLERMIGFLGM